MLVCITQICASLFMIDQESGQASAGLGHRGQAIKRMPAQAAYTRLRRRCTCAAVLTSLAMVRSFHQQNLYILFITSTYLS